MKVYFHDASYQVYTADLAAAAGRMEAVVAALEGAVEFNAIQPAAETDILRVHRRRHLDRVAAESVYKLAEETFDIPARFVPSGPTGGGSPAGGEVRPPGRRRQPWYVGRACPVIVEWAFKRNEGKAGLIRIYTTQ